MALYIKLCSRDNIDCGDLATISCEDSVVADKAFEIAKAYVNSMECNHDQLDRNEGVLKWLLS